MIGIRDNKCTGQFIRDLCSGWDPSAESDNSKSEQVKNCMDLEHCLHLLHLEPTHELEITLGAGQEDAAS
jgi:hypothetical protein